MEILTERKLPTCDSRNKNKWSDLFDLMQFWRTERLDRVKTK